MSFSSCSVVHKVFNKEKHSKDSTVVTSRDSSGQTNSSQKENFISIDSLTFQVEYDTSWLDKIDEPPVRQFNPEDYFTPQGKLLGDVFKAASQAGKVRKITIGANKIENKSSEQIFSQSANVEEKKEVKLSEHTMVMHKEKKKVNWTALVICLFLAALLYIIWRYRKKIWAWILTILPI